MVSRKLPPNEFPSSWRSALVRKYHLTHRNSCSGMLSQSWKQGWNSWFRIYKNEPHPLLSTGRTGYPSPVTLVDSSCALAIASNPLNLFWRNPVQVFRPHTISVLRLICCETTFCCLPEQMQTNMTSFEPARRTTERVQNLRIGTWEHFPGL